MKKLEIELKRQGSLQLDKGQTANRSKINLPLAPSTTASFSIPTLGVAWLWLGVGPFHVVTTVYNDAFAAAVSMEGAATTDWSYYTPVSLLFAQD